MGLTQLARYFADAGYRVTRRPEIAGASGAMHAPALLCVDADDRWVIVLETTSAVTAASVVDAHAEAIDCEAEVVLASTGGYSPDARRWAERLGVRLLDWADVLRVDLKAARETEIALASPAEREPAPAALASLAPEPAHAVVVAEPAVAYEDFVAAALDSFAGVDAPAQPAVERPDLLDVEPPAPDVALDAFLAEAVHAADPALDPVLASFDLGTEWKEPVLAPAPAVAAADLFDPLAALPTPAPSPPARAPVPPPAYDDLFDAEEALAVPALADEAFALPAEEPVTDLVPAATADLVLVVAAEVAPPEPDATAEPPGAVPAPDPVPASAALPVPVQVPAAAEPSPLPWPLPARAEAEPVLAAPAVLPWPVPARASSAELADGSAFAHGLPDRFFALRQTLDAESSGEFVNGHSAWLGGLRGKTAPALDAL